MLGLSGLSLKYGFLATFNANYSFGIKIATKPQIILKAD
jgi:hypothetical protein